MEASCPRRALFWPACDLSVRMISCALVVSASVVALTTESERMLCVKCWNGYESSFEYRSVFWLPSELSPPVVSLVSPVILVKRGALFVIDFFTPNMVFECWLSARSRYCWCRISMASWLCSTESGEFWSAVKTDWLTSLYALVATRN